MRRIMSLALAVCVFASVASAADAPRVQHVVVIGVDGMGAQGVAHVSPPRMGEMMKTGAYTLHARGVFPTSSSPNWMSMISGAGPEQHGVSSNEWEPDKFDIAPVYTDAAGRFPTIFGVVRQQLPKAVIGVFHDWKGFSRLVEPGAPTKMHREDGPVAATDAGIAYFKAKKPALLFIHLDHVDHAGHKEGWLTPAYDAALLEADRHIGRMIDAITEAGMWDSTVLLVTADHGGVGTKHGGMTMAELEIPWILRGATVKRGYEITAPVNTYDTAVTIAYLLGLKPAPPWIAKPVTDALE